MKKITILLTVMCLWTYTSMAQSSKTTTEQSEIEDELVIDDDEEAYERVYTYVDVKPIFCKGASPDSLDNFIKKNLKYPKDLVDSLDWKTVCVRFLVDKKGATSYHKVTEPLHSVLDKEALRVAKLIKFEVPAIYEGKPVKKQYHLYIDFE
ncbi:energy transducer TonB [Prolixibacteraceae bacterium]|nr:energy transducer TonB [Prolixibacteraceae bacterium]